MVAPVQSTVSQFLEMDGSLLSHVLLKFDPIELIHSIGTLRASCKTLKATIESDACALPFLRYLGVNVEKEEWKNAFQKTNAWFPLYQAHLTTPFTILALDYSHSMDELFEPDSPTHFATAWEVVSELFIERQLGLLPEMFVYLFADHCLKMEVSSAEQFVAFHNVVFNNLGGFSRQASELYSVFNDLGAPKGSPIHELPKLTKVLIKVLSDQSFTEDVLSTSLHILSSLTQKKEHQYRSFTVQFVPTSIGVQANHTYRIARNHLKPSSVHVDVDIAPAAKRLRFDPIIPTITELLEDGMDWE